MQVSAVNFGLLSDREQMAIIYSFAQMLNSLSFTIQIVIVSERLNISSYLLLLDKAQKAQTNPLLSQMIIQYKEFIQSTVKDMEVLDKKFYLVIPLFAVEAGLASSKANLKEKFKTILLPRRDQIIRQLNRIGLRSNQLREQELIEVFYHIYNGEMVEKPAAGSINPSELVVRLKNPQMVQNNSENSSERLGKLGEPEGQNQAELGQNIRQSDNPDIRSSDSSGTLSPSESFRSTNPSIATQGSKTHPFVVEELEG